MAIYFRSDSLTHLRNLAKLDRQPIILGPKTKGNLRHYPKVPGKYTKYH